MGPDRWFEFGHMGHRERVPGRGSDLFDKYLPRACFEPGPVVGAGDTQMALASEEVTDEGDRCTDNYQCCDQNGGVHRVR